MAYRSAPLYEDVIWRTHLQPQDPGLAEAVRSTIAENREHLLEFIRLDEPAPFSALTLAQWSSPNALSSLGAMVHRPDGAAINAGPVNAGKSIRCVAGTFPR